MKKQYQSMLMSVLLSAEFLFSSEGNLGESIGHHGSDKLSAWCRFEESWSHTYAQTISGITDKKQQLIKLKESVQLRAMIKIFFTSAYVVVGNEAHVIKLHSNELQKNGRFLYDMSELYDKCFPDRPWGIPKIQSPLNAQYDWTYIWFRIMSSDDHQYQLNIQFVAKK